MIKAVFSRVILVALFLWPLAQVRGAYFYVTNFSKNGNVQANLIAQFPTGLWVATNSFATPFDMVTNAAGQNFYAAYTPLTNSVSIPAVSNVYALINAYAPGGGPVATIEFKGDQGADQIFTLNGGVSVRDFYQGSYVNSINSSTTENAFEVFGVQGGGGTGNVHTGLTGNYVIDEQKFALAPAFQSQHLISIILSGVGNGTPIILGVTAEISAPSIVGVTRTNNDLTLQAMGGETNLTCITLASTNVSAPLTQWLPIATNTLVSNGDFSITLTNAINPAMPHQFFTLELR